MILGTGTDLCHIERIAKTYQKFGSRFLHRIYTPFERKTLQTSSEARFKNRLAMFFAAKEACMKAIGQGLRQGVSWQDIEVRHHQSGRPYLVVTGAVWNHAQRLTPASMEFHFHISLTDEWTNLDQNNRNSLAHAIVILEAVPKKSA